MEKEAIKDAERGNKEEGWNTAERFSLGGRGES